MEVLDVVIGLIESQARPGRRFAVRRVGLGASFHRGAMQASVQEVGDGNVEVVYEHALHEFTRVRVGPESAVRLILAIMQRERLERVEFFETKPRPFVDLR